jgi:hypothetical protein
MLARASFVGVVLLATTLAGCMGARTETRGYPLYPESGARPPPAVVAKLSASLPGGAAPSGGSATFIKAVDGRDVSTLDTAFELLPGCHVVETDSRLFVANEVMSWSGEIGSRTFAFEMKPGYSYTVVVELAERMGGSAGVSVYGVEQDERGAETVKIAPLASGAEAQACRNAGGASPAESGVAPPAK